jgi:hypothetical protein
MANNENLRPIKKGELSKEEAKKRGRLGGINSVKSRRANKSLAERIKLALTISTNENLKVLKKEIRELLPNRNKKENKEALKTLLAQARVMKDCGIDVYNIIKIAQAPETQDIALKATNSLWDREDGRAVSKVENKEVKEFNGEVKYID